MVVEAMENSVASATGYVAATGLNPADVIKRLEETELLKIDQYCSTRSWRSIMYINAVQDLQDWTMALSYFQKSPIASVVEKAHACQANIEYWAVSSYGNMAAVFQFLLYYGYSPYPQVKEHALLQYDRTHETYKVNVGEHAQRDWFTHRRELPAVNAVFQQLQ